RCSTGKRRAPGFTSLSLAACMDRFVPASPSGRCRTTSRTSPRPTRRGTRPGRRRRPTETSMMRLQSYAQGQWVTGTGRATDLFHAVTGEKVGEANSEGLDFKGMLEYGRTVGGPKLRAMTFHERARMLKAMAQHLMAHKDELYQV